ncbi:uncharacterized protein [Rutidosis leptorrhynchoides]|uniref:uncharacterized protein n=1 Tax=Rutidosis leptorrhynchoides TaxID=125765 RepID=UPI003A9A30CE
MEVLTLFLNRSVNESDKFRFHPMCEKLDIINLCFADDLFLFSYANKDSVSAICEALEEFKSCSGLVPSLAKSMAFFANFHQGVKTAILSILPFEDGKLSVRYLGVPLVTSSLMHRDCKPLVDQGKEIEALMGDFLWCQSEMKRGKAKVKWFIVYLPKEEGRLGIKRLKDWNVALLTSQVWRILSNTNSLWVQWIHSYRLKGRNFWDAPGVAGASVGVIHEAGLQRDATVRNIVSASGWCWPASWAIQFPGLNHIAPSILNSCPDVIKWRAWNGDPQVFSVNRVWDTIRPHANLVPWYSLVWYMQCIPRHSFLFWLLMGENLKTQDKLKTQVWSLVKSNMVFNVTGDSWKDFVNVASPVAGKKNVDCIVAKFLFGASVYFIWQERNGRVFKRRSRSCGSLVALIFSTVRCLVGGLFLPGLLALRNVSLLFSYLNFVVYLSLSFNTFHRVGSAGRVVVDSMVDGRVVVDSRVDGRVVLHEELRIIKVILRVAQPPLPPLKIPTGHRPPPLKPPENLETSNLSSDQEFIS